MTAFLVLVGFLFLGLIFHLNPANTPRESALKGFLAVFLLVALSTEFLSLFQIITFPSLTLFWTGVSLITAGYLVVRRKDLRERFREQNWSLSLKTWEWLTAAGILLILGLTLLIALLAPPNTFDSMTYHMARVAEWIQHQSVRFYSTSIPRQNYSMPLAEFAILHLQLLSRSDRLANLVQWTSFVFAINLTSLIAREFGLSGRLQLFTGLLTATLPMAILQSTSTQNDLVVGVFTLAFAYFVLRMVQTKRWELTAWAGISLGLALLTKGTAYLFCGSMGLAVGLGGIWSNSSNRKVLDWIISLAAAALSGLIITSGHLSRNYSLYGHPLLTGNSRITVDGPSLSAGFANLLRNAAVQISLPIPGYNQALKAGVIKILGPLAADPGSTFGGTNFSIRFLINEDYSGNAVHFFLLILAAVFLLSRIKRRKEIVYFYGIGLVLAALSYSFMIKWQPWGSRLQLPLFFIGMPLIGWSAENIFESKKLYSIVSLVVLISSLPFLCLNSTRPVVPLFPSSNSKPVQRLSKFLSDRPSLYRQYKRVLSPLFGGRSVLHTDREKLYFLSNYGFYEDYRGAAEEIRRRSVKEVGFCLENNDWEYPFWVFFDQHAGEGMVDFQHVLVENETAELMMNAHRFPRLVVSSRENCREQLNSDYQTIYQSESVDLLWKQE